MVDMLYPFCALLAWLAAAYTSRDLRRRAWDPPLIVLALAFYLLAATFTISTPAVWVGIDRAAGFPNLSALLSQGSVLAFAACLQVLLLLWSLPRAEAWARIRQRLIGFGLVAALMVALFLNAPRSAERPTDFVVTYAGEPRLMAYFLVYLAAFAVMQVGVIQLCVRYAGLCPSAWLRRGLRITTTGAVLGLVYCGARFADLIAVRLDVDPHRWEPLARLGAGMGEILYLLGWTIPSWGPHLAVLFGWYDRYRSYHALYPLWFSLYRAHPQIAFDPLRSRLLDVLNPRDLEHRLYRRLIEIRDGQLALRPYFDPAVATTVRAAPGRSGLTAEAVEATVEAALLKAALHARALGQPPASPEPHIDRGVEPDGLAQELNRLVAVARAFTRSATATGEHQQPHAASGA